MGLGVAIGGAIGALTMLVIILTYPMISDGIFEISNAKSEISDIQNSIKKTNFTIANLNTTTGSQFVNFTLSNTDLEKLWDFEKFNVIVTYDANIASVKTRVTEQFSYESESSFLGIILPVIIPPITFDDSSSNQGSSTPLTWTHDVTASGSDTILIVGVASKDEPVTSVTYNSDPLTQIRNDAFGVNVVNSTLWYIVNPDTGSNTVEVQLNAGSEVVGGAVSFENVHQTNPINADNGNNGNTGNPSVSLTTTTIGTIIVDNVAILSASGLTVGADQTQRWNRIEGSTAGAGSTEDGSTAGTYTMNWIASEDKEWAISAAALEPMGVSTFFLSCSSNNGFDQSEWIIGGIISDELDPQVINHNEEAVVCIQLNNQVFSNGFVEVSISNELGKSTTSSVTTGS